MPLLRNKPAPVLAPLHSVCPHPLPSQLSLPNAVSWSMSTLHMTSFRIPILVSNKSARWVTGASALLCCIHEKFRIRPRIGRATVSPKLLQQQCAVHTRAFLHTYTHIHSAWDRGSARTEVGKSDSCGREHSAAYRTSARARAHIHTHTHTHTHSLAFIAQDKSLMCMLYCIKCMYFVSHFFNNYIMQFNI